MKIAISIITIISIFLSSAFFHNLYVKTYDKIEYLEMGARVQKLLLQDTKTISGNWKKIALQATDLTTLQQKRLDIQSDSIDKAKQLIRMQENHIERLTK